MNVNITDLFQKKKDEGEEGNIPLAKRNKEG